MIFSQRYARALRERKLSVFLGAEVRRRLWGCMQSSNHPVGVQRDPTNRWIDESDVLSEVVLDYRLEEGWDRLPGNPPVGQLGYEGEIRGLMTNGPSESVMDVIEMTWNGLAHKNRGPFCTKVNQILELEEAPWRLWEGEFFKLDEDFVGVRATQTAFENISASGFSGPADEFAKSRREQASGEIKNAISDACKSYESMLKVLTGLKHVNADRLTKSFVDGGYLDDVPQDIRESIRGAVLMSLPSLRNKLAGHGQGAAVVTVPAIYGELALQLAAALHNFMVAKFLSRKPPGPEPAAETVDDEPF